MDISTDTLIDLFLFVVICTAVLFYLGARSGVGNRVSTRLRTLTEARPAAGSSANANMPPLRRLLRRLARFGDRLPLFDAMQRTRLATVLRQAGLRSPLALSILASAKLGSGVALVLLLQATAPDLLGTTLSMRALAGIGAFVIGLILPEYALKHRVKKRQRQIESALPNALDLLVICTNAGYSLAASMGRSARELERVCPALADELNVTTGELQLSGDSNAALRNLADRVGTPSVRSLVATLIQAQQYGTPITQSLRMLARTERNTRMLALEEKAAKLATKITVPMILFILPTVVLIAGGPAALNLMSAFGGR